MEKQALRGVSWVNGVGETPQLNSRDEGSSFARVHQAHPDPAPVGDGHYFEQAALVEGQHNGQLGVGSGI